MIDRPDPDLLKYATEPRVLLAKCRFAGGPGRHQEAAEAWAFELTYYFLRAVGEQPVVQWSDGVYTVIGPMTTTHPGDRPGPDWVVEFDAPPAPPWDLDRCADEGRRADVRALYELRAGARFDGRDTGDPRPEPSYDELLAQMGKRIELNPLRRDP